MTLRKQAYNRLRGRYTYDMKIRSYNELVTRIESIVDSSPHLHLHRLGAVELNDTSYEMLRIDMGEDSMDKKRVCISAGIHGDEPAGPEAALRFIEEHKNDAELLDNFYFTVFPCDNPSGYELNTRENAKGVDLNREFRKRNASPEVAILMTALSECHYDLTCEMHEDIDAPGFYLYELTRNIEDSVAQEIIRRVGAAGYPVNMSEVIEGLPAVNGIIAPRGRRLRRTRLPKAIYLYRMCCDHVLTLEPPAAHLALEDRVKIELIGLEVALEKLTLR